MGVDTECHREAARVVLELYRRAHAAGKGALVVILRIAFHYVVVTVLEVTRMDTCTGDEVDRHLQAGVEDRLLFDEERASGVAVICFLGVSRPGFHTRVTIRVEEVLTGETGGEFARAHTQAGGVLRAGSQSADQAGKENGNDDQSRMFVHAKGVKDPIARNDLQERKGDRSSAGLTVVRFRVFPGSFRSKQPE